MSYDEAITSQALNAAAAAENASPSPAALPGLQFAHDVALAENGFVKALQAPLATEAAAQAQDDAQFQQSSFAADATAAEGDAAAAGTMAQSEGSALATLLNADATAGDNYIVQQTGLLGTEAESVAAAGDVQGVALATASLTDAVLLAQADVADQLAAAGPLPTGPLPTPVMPSATSSSSTGDVPTGAGGGAGTPPPTVNSSAPAITLSSTVLRANAALALATGNATANLVWQNAVSAADETRAAADAADWSASVALEMPALDTFLVAQDAATQTFDDAVAQYTATDLTAQTAADVVANNADATAAGTFSLAEAPATVTAWTTINTDMQLPWTAFELAKNQALAQSAAPSVASDQEGYVQSVGAVETAYAASDSAAYLTEAQGIDAAVRTEADAEAAADTTAGTTQAGDEAAFETSDALAGQAYRDGMDQAAHNDLVTVAQANHDLAVGAITPAQYDAAVAIAGATQTVTNQTVTNTFGTAEATATTTQMVADAGAVLADQTTVANAVLQLATSSQQLITTYSLAESAAYDTERKADATALFNQELTDAVKTDDALMDAGNSPWGMRLAAQAQADLARQQGPTTDGAQGLLASQEAATDAQIDADLTQEDQQAAVDATFADSEAQQTHDRDVADAQIDDTSVVQQAGAITSAAAADAYFAAAPELPSAPGGYSPITATGDYGHAHNIGGYTIGNATADWKGIVDAMFTATPDALPSVETSPNFLNAPGWAGPVGGIGSWNLPASVSTGTTSGNLSGTTTGPSSAPNVWLQADGADFQPAEWAKQVSAFQGGPQPEGAPPGGSTSSDNASGSGASGASSGASPFTLFTEESNELLANSAIVERAAGGTLSEAAIDRFMNHLDVVQGLEQRLGRVATREEIGLESRRRGALAVAALGESASDEERMSVYFAFVNPVPNSKEIDRFGFDLPTYTQGVPDVATGYFVDAPTEAVVGAYQMVRHPVQTAEGVYLVVTDLPGAAGAMMDGVGSNSQTLRGQGKIGGHVAMIFIPGPKWLELMGKAKNVAVGARLVAKYGDELVDLGEAAPGLLRARSLSAADDVGGAAVVHSADALNASARLEFNPDFVPDGGRVLQNLTNLKNAELGADLRLATTVLSDAELEATVGKIGVARMQYGNAVERLVAEEIERDALLKSLFKHAGGPGKPDFVGQGLLKGKNFDITTELQRAAHQRRPGYGRDLIIIVYERPAGFP